MEEESETARATLHYGGRSPAIWRLGRLDSDCECRGPKDPHDTRNAKYLVGGDLVNPRLLCSSCSPYIPAQDGYRPVEG